MTTDFTASNGLHVGLDNVGSLGVSWSSPRNGGWTIHDPEETAALREYFLHTAPAPSNDELRAVVRAVYGPANAQQWQLDNARDALLAARDIRLTESSRT